MRTSIPLNNFASGQIDSDLKGRFDLPLYQSGGEIVQNFFATLQGNLLYRNGTELLDTVGSSAIYEFEFNEEQSYLLVFKETVIQFWSYTADGVLAQVLSGSTPLEVAHTYGDDRFDLDQRMAQKGDVLYIVHPNHTKAKLTRTAADAFNLAAYTITGNNFTTDGNPLTVSFYEGRLVYGGSVNKPTTLFGSKSASYDDLTVGTAAADGFEFDIAEINSPVLWLYAGQNSLIIGTTEGIATANGGGIAQAITPSTIRVKLSSNEGSYKAKPIEKDGFVIYISQNQRNLYAFQYETLSESFQAALINKASFNITKDKMEKLTYKNDKYNFIYVRTGSDILSLTFSAEEGLRSLTKLKTSNSFDDIKSITRPDGDKDLFVIATRENGVYLERMTDYLEFSSRDDIFVGTKEDDTDAYNRLIAEEFKSINYLDSSVTYNGYYSTQLTYVGLTAINSIGEITSTGTEFSSGDIGRKISYKTVTGYEYGIFEIVSFTSSSVVGVKVLYEPTALVYTGWYLYASVFSGLSHLEGQVVSIVGDGGYIGDFTVASGSIDISNTGTKQVSVANIGLKYKGIFKSFNYGLSFQGVNTQSSVKTIYKAVLRFLFSAGGEFGDSLYNLRPIQKFNPSGLYDNPPLPMDTDEDVKYNSGGFKQDKRIYIVQDNPLPLQIAMIVPYVKQINNT